MDGLNGPEAASRRAKPKVFSCAPPPVEEVWETPEVRRRATRGDMEQALQLEMRLLALFDVLTCAPVRAGAGMWWEYNELDAAVAIMLSAVAAACWGLVVEHVACSDAWRDPVRSRVFVSDSVAMLATLSGSSCLGGRMCICKSSIGFGDTAQTDIVFILVVSNVCSVTKRRKLRDETSEPVRTLQHE
jgi:hypothetical protein